MWFRYLSCDKYGLFSATASAISQHESFLIHPSPDIPGAFFMQTQGGTGESDTFVSVKEGAKGVEIRGDENSLSFQTTLRVRMQARFKPRIKANKETKAREKISRKELEEIVGRRLNEDEVKKLRRARREGNFHEEVLDVRVRGKHDKFA
jgi:protein FRG1